MDIKNHLKLQILVINWFELRTVKFTIAGKKANGFEIIKRKD